MIRYPLRLATSLLGYGIMAFVVWWQWTANFHGLPPDLGVWDRVGDQVRAGISPYGVDYPWGQWFFYAPPWGVAFAAVSWLPPIAQAGVVMALEVGALRYIAGSWLRAGYFGLFPLTGAELGNGSFNLVLAAGIAAAMRGDGRLATFGALAKFSPIMAVRDWRGAGVVLLVAGLVTLPFLGWWREWIEALLWAQSHQSIGYPLWWPGRVAAAIALMVAVRKPWSRGLAAALAIPAIYSYSLVLLYPAIAELTAGRWTLLRRVHPVAPMQSLRALRESWPR